MNPINLSHFLSLSGYISAKRLNLAFYVIEWEKVFILTGLYFIFRDDFFSALSLGAVVVLLLLFIAYTHTQSGSAIMSILSPLHRTDLDVIW